MKTIVEMLFCVTALEKELEIETYEFKSIVIGDDLFLEDCINDSAREIEEEVVVLLIGKDLKYDAMYRIVIDVEFESVRSFDGEVEEWDTEIICKELSFNYCYPLPTVKEE